MLGVGSTEDNYSVVTYRTPSVRVTKMMALYMQTYKIPCTIGGAANVVTMCATK